jgi:methyl-accepting chemotaxis protein
MRIAQRLSIRTKLLVAPIVAITLFAVCIAVALALQSRQNAGMNALLDDDVANYAIATSAATGAASGHAALLEAVAAARNNAKPATVKAISDRALREVDEARANLRRRAETVADAATRDAMKPVADALDRYRKSAAEALEMADSDVNLAAMAVQSAGAQFDKARAGVAALLDHTRDNFAQQREFAQDRYRWSVIATVAVALAAVVLSLGAALLLSRAITRPIGVLVGAIERCEQGDLGVAVRVEGDDEIARSCDRFNRMSARLREVIGTVRDDAVVLSRAATALSTTTSQVSAATEQQSEAASAMAASVEQMTVSIDQVSEHSHEALTASRRSGELSDEGNAVVSRAAEEMESIGAAARELTAIIQGLGERSGQISRIVSVIQEIANQTNLLALNAAIEAARAGEQGRGFSVVAEEVRRLAERTTASTQEISAMVGGIQEGTHRAVSTMGLWSTRVSDGVTQARGAGDCMTRIRGGAGDVVTVVGEISNALKEQSSASNEIARNVERIAQMSEENAAAVSSMADAAKDIDRRANSLAALVAGFRTESTTA